MSMEVHQSRVLKGGAKRTVRRIPGIPSPAPNRGKLDLHRQPEKGTAKFHGSKSCINNPSCCSDKGGVQVVVVGNVGCKRGWWCKGG